jgi:hypothetical protein
MAAQADATPRQDTATATATEADTATDAAAGAGSDGAWEERVAQAWAAYDDEEPEAFRARIAALAAQRPEGDAAALFERAAAHDSTGQPQHAEPLYRQALDAGLTGLRRRRAVIQLASTLRNLGRPLESVALLEAERASGVSDDLDDALVCVLALTLERLGRAREGLGLMVEAMAKHLPRYNRSMAAYGADLAESARADADSADAETTDADTDGDSDTGPTAGTGTASASA